MHMYTKPNPVVYRSFLPGFSIHEMSEFRLTIQIKIGQISNLDTKSILSTLKFKCVFRAPGFAPEK